MKDRLVKIMGYKKMSPIEFSKLLGIQRSSISHILSGRNMPSFDMISKILALVPEVSAKWLVLGDGEMLESVNLVEKEVQKEKVQEVKKEEAPNIFDTVEVKNNKIKDTRKIKKVILLYNDGSFESFEGNMEFE